MVFHGRQIVSLDQSYIKSAGLKVHGQQVSRALTGLVCMQGNPPRPTLPDGFPSGEFRMSTHSNALAGALQADSSEMEHRSHSRIRQPAWREVKCELRYANCTMRISAMKASKASVSGTRLADMRCLPKVSCFFGTAPTFDASSTSIGVHIATSGWSQGACACDTRLWESTTCRVLASCAVTWRAAKVCDGCYTSCC